jgi:DNA-binding Xre family transcriptional regulator
LSQQALGELAGVRQATVSELERGLKKQIDLRILDRLCAALDVAPGELLVRERDGKRRGRG